VAFGVDLLPGAGGNDAHQDRRTAEQMARQNTDTLVGQLVTAGDLTGALELAYEAQRTRIDDLAAQRRYHNVLLLSDKADTLRDHAQRYIALLLRRQQSAEALKVYLACQGKDPTFVLEDATAVLTLAQAQWRGGNARSALTLITGFDKRFRGHHEAIPKAYELAARILVQELHNTEMARKILHTLETRYPESEQTSEVRWLLRDVPTA